MSVYVCVCLSVCVSVWATPFEAVDIETSFLVWCDILTISTSGLSIKVIGVKVKVISWKILLPGHQFNLV